MPFARYAARRIRGALLDELRSADWATRSLRGRVRERNSMYESLTAHLGRTPSPDELARALGISPAELQRIEGDLHQSVVLRIDHLATEAGADAILPSTAETPESVLVERERQSYLRDAVHSLPERLQKVVRGCFFEDRPMRELAEELGVTESRISQLRAEALKMLKDGMNSQLAPEMLPERPRASRPTGARRTTPRSPAAPRSTRASACPACARPRWSPRPPDVPVPLGSARFRRLLPQNDRSTPSRRPTSVAPGQQGGSAGRAGSGLPKKFREVSQVAAMAADESPVGTGR